MSMPKLWFSGESDNYKLEDEEKGLLKLYFIFELCSYPISTFQRQQRILLCVLVS